jgi:hypothetical protein
MLGFPYLCAWQYTLRDAMFAGDDELIAQSIERLREELASNPNFVDIRQYEDEAIDKAELGDPGPLQQMIEIKGCAAMQWESGTPGTDPSPETAFATSMILADAEIARRPYSDRA